LLASGTERASAGTDSRDSCFGLVAISKVGLGKASLTRLSFGKFSGEGYKKYP
jgi:hypothetical protein